MCECEDKEENNNTGQTSKEEEKDKIFSISVLIPPFIYHPTYMSRNFVENLHKIKNINSTQLR